MHSHASGHRHEHAHDHSHQSTDPPAPDASTPSPVHESDLLPDLPQSESAHQSQVIATFDSYLLRSNVGNQRRRANYYALKKEHKELLGGGYLEILDEVEQKLRVNNRLVERMIEENPFIPEDEEASLSAPAPTEGDHDKLRSTLRQCVRDWSSEGKAERDATYAPILNILERVYFPLDLESRAKLQVLVPGAGLGRLAWEIVKVANEFSLYMLIACSFILNHTTGINEFTIHPWLHSFSNFSTTSSLLSPYTIPDVLPSSLTAISPFAQFSFASGNFLHLYTQAASFDSIVTCFFIDTSRNVIEYLEKIWFILKDGGIWINNGPSMWHFEGEVRDSREGSIELVMDDVKALARKIGFVFSEEKEIETTYTANPRSNLKSVYTASFWVATKPAVE